MKRQNFPIPTDTLEMSDIELGEIESETLLPLETPQHWFLEYFPDFSVVLLLIPSLIVLKFIQPFQRPIDLKDPDIYHPHLQDFVGGEVLYFISLGLPLLVCVALSRSLLTSLKFTNSLVQGWLVNQVVTDGLKLLTGRFRPDFMDRCKPVNETCTGSPYSIENGRKSWPSGHSSMSFFGMTFLTLWLVYHGLKSLDTPKWRSVKNIVCITPIFIAAFVGVSRVRQYVHHPTDVISGAALGIAIAAIYFFNHHH
jgi:diacylglycerol diphosphate phosphatase / phosphatidate phosphatase